MYIYAYCCSHFQANSKLNSTVQTSKLELQPDDPNLVDLTDTETMEESPDLSLSEPADGPAFKVDFNRHLVKTVSEENHNISTVLIVIVMYM